MIGSNEKIFEHFIKKYEQRTVNFLSSKYTGLSKECIKDIIQDSYVALYNNIKTNKITEPQYSYFLKICINLSLKAIRYDGRQTIISINDTDIQQPNMISMSKVESALQVCDEYEMARNEKKQLVHNALNDMASRCRELLWSFYADELSWATIAGQFGLKNADTAKTQASRCRHTFKEKYNHLKRKFYGK